ncbi:MAG: biopolymer transporter ExbD [bacterium]
MHNLGSDEEDGQIAAINIIPLVDVVLVLLIIFMVTTVFARDNAMKIDLPKGSRPEQVTQPPAEVSVTVNKDGLITVNNVPCTVKELKDRVLSLTNQNSKTVVILRGDKSTLYGSIIPALDQIASAGVTVTLAYSPPTAP